MPHILIVEDNPIEAREISFFVGAAGFEVDVSANAEQGFAQLRASAYDLLLADLHLPGENGFHLCRRVKGDSQLAGLPVVLLTRFADPINVLRGLEAGADGFISKGQQPREIVERLTRILQRKATTPNQGPSSHDRIVFLQTEFELDASRNQLLEVLLAGFEDAVVLNQKYEKEVAAHARAQKSIRDLNVLYHSLVETLPLGITRKDLEGRYTFANPQFCEQWKIDPSEIVGRSDADLFSRALAEQFEQDEAAVIRTGQILDRIQAIGLNEDAQYVQVRRVPLRDAKRNLIGIQGIYSDVTEMKRAERQLLLLNQSLEARVAERTHELELRNE
ncbi:MAG TPA: response regulator, partial [Pirellulales bacterium]|nr:response regulator [Pirellulales bacterium]